MGRPDAVKVVDRCLEERHVLSEPGARGLSRVRTAPGQERVVVTHVCGVLYMHSVYVHCIYMYTCTMCMYTCTCMYQLFSHVHVHLHSFCSLIVFGSETVVPHCLMDSGLESGQSGSQDMGTGE